jgi:putative ABC transport system ATP-binding protein
MNNSTPVLAARSLSKHYETAHGEVRAVDEVTLDISEGDFLAIVGASGSGKSTLLSLLGGLLEPTSGSVSLDGTDMTDLSRGEVAELRRFRIGFVFQAFHLFEHLTSEENVMFPMSFAPISWEERRDRAQELLELVGLAHRYSHFPRQLSGGERQRVAIARALANRPTILLADEPTGNLDAESTHVILGLFQGLNQEQDQTILIVTHDPLVQEYTDHSISIESGRLVDVSRGGN